MLADYWEGGGGGGRGELDHGSFLQLSTFAFWQISELLWVMRRNKNPPNPFSVLLILTNFHQSTLDLECAAPEGRRVQNLVLIDLD